MFTGKFHAIYLSWTDIGHFSVIVSEREFLCVVRSCRMNILSLNQEVSFISGYIMLMALLLLVLVTTTCGG